MICQIISLLHVMMFDKNNRDILATWMFIIV
jgi:hypothetical protein